MRTLYIMLGTGAVVALLGLNVAVADFKNDTLNTSVSFSLDIGNGVPMPDVTFDTGSGSGEAQATCMMTPGGPSTSVILDLPPLNPPVAGIGYSAITPQATLAPINSFNAPLGTTYRPPYSPTYNDPNGNDPEVPNVPEDPNEEPPPVVPAPATLVIVGLGIAGVAATRRRWTK